MPSHLPLHRLQLLRVTLLPRILLLGSLDQFLVLFRSWLDRRAVWQRVAYGAGLERDLRLHYFAVLVDGLRDGEDCEGLGNGDENGIVGDEAARADAPTVAEDVVARVGLGLVGRSREIALGAEDRGLGVDGRVVGKVPLAHCQWICAT